MNPQYQADLKKINSFWTFVSENIQHIKPHDLANDIPTLKQIKSRNEDPKAHYLSLSVSTLVYIDLCERLSDIDPEIEVFVGTDFINFTNYDIHESVSSRIAEHVHKIIVVRNYIEFTASGNIDKFLLLDVMKSTSGNYKIPDNWIVSIYKKRSDKYLDHMLVPYRQMGIGTSTLKFALKPISEFDETVRKEIDVHDEIPLDQQFDLMIIVEDEFAIKLKDQEAVIRLRNSFLLWLESIIGEYATAMNITRLTIIPEQGLTELVKRMGSDGAVLLGSLRNGVYLIQELTDRLNVSSCELCGVQKTHLDLKLYKDDGTFKFDDFKFAHPHIREGYYCNFCFGVLEKINENSI